MPTITLTITLTVPEGTNFEVKTDTAEEPLVQVVETPAIEQPEPMGKFHGEYGDAPSVERTWVGWWSPVEDELAQDMTISDEELAAAIDRTPAAVHTYRTKQGYHVPSYQRVLVPTERSMARWTDAEDAELVATVRNTTEVLQMEVDWAQIGKHLGRSAAAVQRRFNRLADTVNA